MHVRLICPNRVFQPDEKAISQEELMLDEYGSGHDPAPDNDTLKKPLVAVFPHPLHGRLVERVVMMVSHAFNYKGIRYRFTWKNSGEAYYTPLAEIAPPRPLSRVIPKKGQMSLPFSFGEVDISAY
jgi:hypothetical protein